MIMNSHDCPLKQARNLAEVAAQWLEVIRFSSHRGSTVFSPSLSHYHDMLSPDATDDDRLESCKAMREALQTRIVIEEQLAREHWLQERPSDPYKKEWKTTRDGATFTMLAHLLTVAIRAFEAEQDAA